jgi:hypothetical protein
MQRELPDTVHHKALRELARRLRAELPALVDETEGLLHREQPELVQRVDPAMLREGIAMTHERFIALLEDPGVRGEARHVALGAAVAGAGVSVEALLAGYRVGAQVGWRHTARLVGELGVPSDAVLALATASLAYMDELATDSLEGFAREAAAVGGARARERQALIDALVAGRDATAPAGGARWPLPARLRVAVLLGPADGLDDRALLLGHADGSAVAIAREEDDALLAASGAPLALGPAVPPEQAALSLARARRVAALVAAGVLPEGRVLRWDDHLADLVVHADAGAAEALAARRLAPLEGLPEARAALLRETLAAWLAHPGRPREIARELHLHHQTVRYRLGRLRERFGDALDDPQARFELALALRASNSRPALSTPPVVKVSMSAY